MDKCEYSGFLTMSSLIEDNSEVHAIRHEPSGIMVKEHLAPGVTPHILLEADARLWKKIKAEVLVNWVRPGSVDPSWITPIVIELTRSITDAEAYNRLPLLADALENAGCTNALILNHCRASHEHPRGCWVLDLLSRSF